MISKVREKELAVKLRKRGFTYKEIISKLPVAKSSLSLWLKDLPLTDKEKNYLKRRKDSNIKKGRIRAASANRSNRLARQKLYAEEAKKEFYEKQKNTLFLVGIAIYWAEGSKRGGSCAFMNSDVEMVKLFVKWLKIFGIKESNLDYALYIHKHYVHERCEYLWSKAIGVPAESIKVYFKPDNKRVKRRPNYQGCLRVRVRRGANLLFRLKIWQNMLANKFLK